MAQDQSYDDLLQSISKKSLNLLSGIGQQGNPLPQFLKQYIDLTQNIQDLFSIIIKNPEQVWQMQMAYWKDAMSLSMAQMQAWLDGKSIPATDKRFSAEEWVNNPFFNLLSKHYLLASEHLNSLLEHIEYGDKNLAKRVQFFARQYIDALSPANYLSTNPQLIAETIQSHGKNLLQGLNNLLSDIDSGSSRLIIKMTDTDAFTVGENIAVTPGEVIFRNEMMELIQYSPSTKEVKSIPLLIIPPWINKFYILDLSPHNSLVKWLVDQGITVFLISWVNPDAQFAKKQLEDYLEEGPVTALAVIKKQLKVKEVNTLGFCIGGTLLACLLAYLTAKGDKSIKSATLLASMIDFSDPGDIGVYIDDKQIEILEKEMAKKGYLDSSFMTNAFNSLRSSDLIWSFFIKNYLQGKSPVPFDLLFWNADGTNMPATMHSEYLRWMYLQNDLIKPNKIHLNGTPIDVHAIKTPACFVSTKNDHIAPWKTTYIGYLAFKGKKQFILGESGHIAGIVNAPSNKKYGYYHLNQVIENPEQWLEKAEHASGSWWPYWFLWHKTYAGPDIKAPNMAQLPYKSLGSAPGIYVLAKKV